DLPEPAGGSHCLCTEGINGSQTPVEISGRSIPTGAVLPGPEPGDHRGIPDLPKDGSYRDETLPCRFEPAAQSAGKHRPDVRLSKPDRTVPHKGHSANAKGGFQDLFRCGTKAAEPGDRKAGCADGTADDYPPDAGDADIRYPDPDAGLPVGTERRDYHPDPADENQAL